MRLVSVVKIVQRVEWSDPLPQGGLPASSLCKSSKIHHANPYYPSTTLAPSQQQHEDLRIEE